MVSAGVPFVVHAYSYLRFSSAKQAKGDSRRRQEQYAVDVAKRNKWILDQSLHLSDSGVSAFRGKNASTGALADFLHCIESGRVCRGSVLIVESLDRLSRADVDEAYDLFRRIIRSGVAIQTREPERFYDTESCRGNILALLEPLFIMSRANEESATKSMRIRERWKNTKRRAVQEKRPLGSLTPAWIEQRDGKYHLIASRARIVRRIFKLAADGLGARRIAARLNAEGVETFGRAGRWIDSYVGKILISPSAYGACQLRSLDFTSNRRVKDGELITNFYPAAISETTFYRARAAIESRRQKSGRPPRGESNLFTGIAFNAVDKQPLHLITGNGHLYLSSNGLRVGGVQDLSSGFVGGFRYDILEPAVLSCITELTAVDVQEGGDEKAERIRELTDALIAADSKAAAVIGRISDKSTTAEMIDAIVAQYAVLVNEKKEIAQALAALKADAASGPVESLAEGQSLVKLLREAWGKDVESIRLRLKSRLRLVIDSIYVAVQYLDYRARCAHVQVNLRGGAVRYFRVFAPRMPTAGLTLNILDLSEVDLRTTDPRTLPQSR